ncbi:MAG: flagellar hook-associated protein FlgK, partial [Clostridium sp.]|nr:flagellar hook-associated protein FlgK [Clostridium sp.]
KYTFELNSPLTSAVNENVEVGKSVSTKGIPYYMNQLTTFARTFASNFNKIHNSGQDLEGKQGVDFFTANVASTPDQYEFTEGLDSFTFSSKVNPVKNANGYVSASYYAIDCKNFTVNDKLANDPNMIACAENIDNGVSEKGILTKLINLKSDTSMFRQGTPDMFLQKLTTDVGTDAKKATVFTASQKNILQVVDTQRMSVSSVDKDEEAMDLVKFQNAYNLSSKVIQTMNEIYNTLINGLGI